MANIGLRIEPKREPTIEALAGLWSRSLIDWPDGRSDRTTFVNWMQGPSYYLDLRQPADRPDFRGVENLRALQPEQLDWLATQEGFAGELHYADGFFEWRREIDFQPQAIYSDQGRLWMEPDMMVEEGKDIPYIEHWHREPVNLDPVCALRLDDPADGTRAYLMRLGSLFMYARARGAAVPAGLHLQECVKGAASLTDAQDLVDCEISQGIVTGAGWIIQRSSLPFREKARIDPVWAAKASGTIVLSDVDADGNHVAQSWKILDAQGALDAFPAAGKVRSAF
ncbi:hypothetical protein F2P47_02285 [Parvibaculum sedimenti]|uniref:Uncharacterized protein n=1 Tax=Parvibaculum sedimenti TaxID=2608632 RepID=A0A6N6VN94_9HYPH|nr:hypothetical protein [Parvibaculum sedimenti]KAB7742122.1 hypothetical protein F2P47_02285 [Parvibaculum sedimenti]